MLMWTCVPSRTWILTCPHVSVLSESAHMPGRMHAHMQESPLHISVNLGICAHLHTHILPHPCSWVHTDTPYGQGATAALFLSRPGGHCLNCMFALDEPWGLQDGRPGGVGLRCQPARPLMKIIRKCGGGRKGLGSWSLQKEMPPKEDQSLVCSLNKWGRYLIGFCGPGSAASDLCEPR